MVTLRKQTEEKTQGSTMVTLGSSINGANITVNISHQAVRVDNGHLTAAPRSKGRQWSPYAASSTLPSKGRQWSPYEGNRQGSTVVTLTEEKEGKGRQWSPFQEKRTQGSTVVTLHEEEKVRVDNGHLTIKTGPS